METRFPLSHCRSQVVISAPGLPEVLIFTIIRCSWRRQSVLKFGFTLLQAVIIRRCSLENIDDVNVKAIDTQLMLHYGT